MPASIGPHEGNMEQYLVTWSVQVDAESEAHAVELAHAMRADADENFYEVEPDPDTVKYEPRGNMYSIPKHPRPVKLDETRRFPESVPAPKEPTTHDASTEGCKGCTCFLCEHMENAHPEECDHGDRCTIYARLREALESFYHATDDAERMEALGRVFVARAALRGE